MAIVIPDNFGLVSYELALDNDPERMFVTLGVEVIAPESFTGLAALLWTGFATTALTLMGAGYSLEAVQVDGQADGDPVIDEWVQSQLTASTDEPTPQNSAYLIRKRSASSAKGKSGRMYLPGIPEDFVTPNGMIEPAQLTAVRATVQDWFEDIQGTTGVANIALFHNDPLIRHDPDTGERIEVPNPDPDPDTVVAFFLEPQIATQRRRLR
jgi:hypothetical protein